MHQRLTILLVVIAVILGGCGGSQSAGTATPIPTNTPIAAPTLTATPVVPLAILIVPANLDADTSNLYQKTVYDLAQASGMRFQVRNTLTPADLEPGLKVVIALPPDPGIAALAAAAPQVQFLTINIPGLTAGGNVSVLGSTSQSGIAGFLAGYTAALITDDYRIGMLMPKDNPDALRALNAYNAGMVYYCGICRGFYYYQYAFPGYLEIPAEEDKANYHGWADVLINQYKVQTIFLYPDIATPDLISYLSTTGISMIGMASPGQRPGGWVMTIQPDVIKAIQNAWPDLIAGKGGVTVQSPLGLADVDPSLLSPGKQRLVQQTLDDLQSGYISTGATP